MRQSLITLCGFTMCLGLASACGVEQDPACATYETCVEHYATAFDFEETPEMSAYREGGDCWRDADTGRQCAAECQQTTEALAQALRLGGKDAAPCEN